MKLYTFNDISISKSRVRDGSSQVRELVEFPLTEGISCRTLVRLRRQLLLVRSRGRAHDTHHTVLLQKTQRGGVRPGGARVAAGGGTRGTG